jgi:hypothetical protein
MQEEIVEQRHDEVAMLTAIAQENFPRPAKAITMKNPMSQRIMGWR